MERATGNPVARSLFEPRTVDWGPCESSIVGNGGREHTLAWKLLRDAPEATLFVTQPNGGMTSRVEPVAIAPGDVEALTGWASAQSIDLVVIGPEAPLATGLADRLERSGIPRSGPPRRPLASNPARPMQRR